MSEEEQDQQQEGGEVASTFRFDADADDAGDHLQRTLAEVQTPSVKESAQARNTDDRPAIPRPRALPTGITQGIILYRNEDDGAAKDTLEIDIREFVGWWDTEQKTFIDRIRAAAPKAITVNIASPGGFVADALPIHDFLKAYPAPVTVNITGLTASAATMIAMAGDRVRMSENALFLAHYGRYEAYGTVEDIERAAESLRTVNRLIFGLYKKRVAGGDMDDDDLDDYLKADTWLTAAEARAHGFIDEIFEPAAATATACALPEKACLAAVGLPEIPHEYRAKAEHDRAYLDRIDTLERQVEALRHPRPAAPTMVSIDAAAFEARLRDRLTEKLYRLRGQA